MGILYIVLSIILIVGLIKPSLILRWTNEPTRLKVILFYFLSIIITGFSVSLLKIIKEDNSKISTKKKNSKRVNELELIDYYKKRQFERITDKDGFLVQYSISKKNIKFIPMGKSENYIYEGEYGAEHSNYLEIGVRKVLLSLEVNGVVLHEIPIVEQVYDVVYDSESTRKRVENLFFQPELQSLGERKRVFERIEDLHYRGKWFGAGQNSGEWTRINQHLIKSSGILDINTFMDFEKFAIYNSDTYNVRDLKD